MLSNATIFILRKPLTGSIQAYPEKWFPAKRYRMFDYVLPENEVLMPDIKEHVLNTILDESLQVFPDGKQRNPTPQTGQLDPALIQRIILALESEGMMDAAQYLRKRYLTQ